MKKVYKVVFATAVLIIIASAATAQINELQEMTMVIPAESLAKVVKSLLPYEIDLGRNFVGRFFVRSFSILIFSMD